MLPVRQIHNTGIGNVDPEEREAAAVSQRLRTSQSRGISGTAGETFALEVFEKEKAMKHIEDISIGAKLVKAQLLGNIQSYITIATDGESVFCVGNGQNDDIPVLMVEGIFTLYSSPEKREEIAGRILTSVRRLNAISDEKGKKDAH